MTPRDSLRGALKAIGVEIDDEAAGRAMHEMRKNGYRVGRVGRRARAAYQRRQKERESARTETS